VRELAEEAGYESGQLEQVGSFNPFNGVTNEMCRVYVARKLRRTTATPDVTEEFEHLELTPSEIDQRIRSGEIWDGMSIAAWSIARPTLL
jgi:ADP-ribose pyrophosphatase